MCRLFIEGRSGDDVVLLCEHFPERVPGLAEDCELDQVPALTLEKDLLLQHAFAHIAALLAVALAPPVVLDHHRLDLVEVESVEGVVEEKHLGFGAIALAPALLLADERAGRRHTIFPLDSVKTHGADRLPISDNHEDKIVRLALVEVLEPPTLVRLHHRQVGAQVLRHLRVIHPPQQQRQITRQERTKHNALTFPEHHFRLHLVSHRHTLSC